MSQIVLWDRFFVYVPRNVEGQINKYIRPKRVVDYEQPRISREYYNRINYRKLFINEDEEGILNTDVSVTLWNSDKLTEEHKETPARVDPYYGGYPENTSGNRTICVPLMIKRVKAVTDTITEEEAEKLRELGDEDDGDGVSDTDLQHIYTDIVHVEGARCKFDSLYAPLVYDKVWVNLNDVNIAEDTETDGEEEAESVSTIYRNETYGIGKFNDLLHTNIEDGKSEILRKMINYKLVLSAQIPIDPVFYTDPPATNAILDEENTYTFGVGHSCKGRFINQVHEWTGKIGKGTVYPGTNEPDIDKVNNRVLVTLDTPFSPSDITNERWKNIVLVSPNNQSMWMIPLGRVTQGSNTGLKKHELKIKPANVVGGNAKYWNYIKFDPTYCVHNENNSNKPFRGMLPSMKLPFRNFDNTGKGIRTRQKFIIYILRDKGLSDVPSGFTFLPFRIEEAETGEV